MKKLFVDKMICQGFVQCEALAPALFRLNEHRIAVVLKQPESEEELALAKAAVKACPRHAIRLKDV
jgi:ferredoxin